MKKIKVKARAKVNFTLDVAENQNGYHNINSVVASINLADEITVTKRADRRISLKTLGINPQCNVVDNNAYKASKLFKETFNTTGVDIVINKKIPVGAGLGGSSANVAGVLKAMDILFGGGHDIVPLANALGSDCAYMLNGGFAVISGRGTTVTPIETHLEFYLIIMTALSGVSTREVYNAFDNLKIKQLECTKTAVELLKKDQKGEFVKLLKNDLYRPASEKVPEIKANLETLSGVAPSVMTGSGSSVFAVFLDKTARDTAYRALKKKYKEKILKADTDI